MKLRSCFLFVYVAASALAQLAASGDSGVAMGHLHLNTADAAAQKRFWTEFVGAKPAKNGALTIPGALIMLKQAPPTGDSSGSTVNHVGVLVKDLDAYREKVKAAGYKVVMENPRQVMFLGPDDLKVELTVDPNLSTPVANHHIHFFDSDVDATKAWYVKMFGAKPGKRGQFEAADLPGVNLSFSKAPEATAPTKGRALDHIGFEVKNLEAFCKNLEAQGVKFDQPYRKLDKLGIAVAFLTDPWGTYIELTEGLNSW